VKLSGIAFAIYPNGRFPKRGEKGMQIQKATKVLKRVWKAAVWVELVVMTALLLFFVQFFSFDVFMSNFHRQASASSSTQPR
jgi:hypothetical protein